MTKTIRIKLSDEDTTFFSELLKRDDIEIVSDDDASAEFGLITYKYLESLLNQINKLDIENTTFRVFFLSQLVQINGYANVLLLGKVGDLTEKQEEYLKTIVSLSQKLEEQVHSLRDS